MSATISTPVENWEALADKVLEGGTLSREEALAVLGSPDDQLLPLLAATSRVRQRHFGNQVQLYYLRNAKSGLCPEDCTYCSQSKISEAPIEKYVMQNEEKLLEGARQAAASNSRTYCIVASGRGPTDREVEHVARTVRKIKDELGMHICCCLGILSPEQALKLKEAGVDRINHNLNTSRRFHEEICTTHTYEDRLATLRVARNAGLELCAGLIVGMGENHADVVDVAFELRELGVESIPVNFLNSIDGTPLEDRDDITPRDCLRTLCLFRLTNPQTEIRIAGGREVKLRSMQAMGLYAANSMFVSDYLTTAGQAAELDFQMVRDLGFEIVTGDAQTKALLETKAAESNTCCD
ncbi:MAG TPA: biotin synthase BioB [Planctomycetaceae bacterium]|nr:biotin synthase BioB [Planctomycetaceae bacterium]